MPSIDRHMGKLERFAYRVTGWVGTSLAFALACLLTLLWLISGPLFHWSDTWQLVMNTISSIVTFLMVFLIQRSQNKDTLALQVKLDELIAAQHGASNRLIGAEDLSEDAVHQLHARFQQLAQRLQSDADVRGTTSIEACSEPPPPNLTPPPEAKD